MICIVGYHVAIGWRYLAPVAMPTMLSCRDERGTAAHEWIEDDVTIIGERSHEE